MTTELAIRDAAEYMPRLVVEIDDMEKSLGKLEDFKRRIMVSGVDYGVVPGTSGKPTLLKPGAEKLATAFGLTPTFESITRVEDWEHGFFAYQERCVLTSRHTGIVIASASGACNTKESRYRWRDAKPHCPTCGGDLRRSRNRDGEQGEPGWYCWNNPSRGANGCGANWPYAQITGPFGRIENPEPWELVNTVLKQAQKRALVAAVLIATGGSGTWTQDVEDMEEADVAPGSPSNSTVIEHRPRPNGPTRVQQEAAVRAAEARIDRAQPQAPKQNQTDVLRERYAKLVEACSAKGIELDPEEHGIGEEATEAEISGKIAKLAELYNSTSRED